MAVNIFRRSWTSRQWPLPPFPWDWWGTVKVKLHLPEMQRVETAWKERAKERSEVQGDCRKRGLGGLKEGWKSSGFLPFIGESQDPRDIRSVIDRGERSISQSFALVRWPGLVWRVTCHLVPVELCRQPQNLQLWPRGLPALPVIATKIIISGSGLIISQDYIMILPVLTANEVLSLPERVSPTPHLRSLAGPAPQGKDRPVSGRTSGNEAKWSLVLSCLYKLQTGCENWSISKAYNGGAYKIVQRVLLFVYHL